MTPSETNKETPVEGGEKGASPRRGKTGSANSEVGHSGREEKVKTSVTERRASPIHTRGRLGENYEEPVSGREAWWRCTIKETPNPGSYEYDDFISELEKKEQKSSFMSEGRKRNPRPYGTGDTLLPGAYSFEDLTQRLQRSRTTYSFKDTGRHARDMMNFGRKDKDINLCPTMYSTDKHLTLSVEKQPSRHWNFRSQTKRFPTIYFEPKPGPSPGAYEYENTDKKHVISSSFKSKTPRFTASHTRVPGPGTYEKTFQSPMTKSLSKMGRNHGVFFSSKFQC